MLKPKWQIFLLTCRKSFKLVSWRHLFHEIQFTSDFFICSKRCVRCRHSVDLRENRQIDWSLDEIRSFLWCKIVSNVINFGTSKHVTVSILFNWWFRDVAHSTIHYIVSSEFLFHKYVMDFMKETNFLNHRLPYNWKSVPAYLLTSLVQYLVLFYANHFYICVLEMLVGFCLYIADFAMDLQHKIMQFELTVKSKVASKGKLIEIKMELLRIIQFHADATQLRLVLSHYR